MRRLVAAAAAGLLLLGTLTACSPTSDQNPTAEWLAAQPLITEVQVLDPKASDASYTVSLRAELAEDATEEQIKDLANEVIDHLSEDTDEKVWVQLGQHLVDFGVTTKVDTAEAFTFWTGISRLAQVSSALVLHDRILANTARTDTVLMYDGLRGLGTDLTVNGGGGNGAAPFSVRAAAGCEPAKGAFDFARSLQGDPIVQSGVLNMCEGFQVTLVQGSAMAQTAPQLAVALDAVGLAEFPVTLVVPPATQGSGSVHAVAVTPGSPDALGVIAALEESGLDLRFELKADRSLLVQSPAITKAQLFSVLASSPAVDALGTITVIGVDGEVAGTFAELSAQLG